MIPGISYWSFEGGLTNTLAVEIALAKAKSAGFKAMELAIGDTGVLHVNSTESECRNLRAHINSSGVHVSTVACGLSWSNNPVSNNAWIRKSLWLLPRPRSFVPLGWVAKRSFTFPELLAVHSCRASMSAMTLLSNVVVRM